jgi:HEPN domain-containing protein
LSTSGPDQLAIESRRWLRLAKDDLAGARALLERDDVAPHLACYHAQQAAEKAIKARLTRRGVEFPRTHDLVALRALLPQDLQRRIDLDAAKELSAWAIEGRYPGDAPEATREQARHAVDLAIDIVAPPARRRSRRENPPRQGA